MKSLTYLNGILTVLAILLGLNLATQWTASPAADVFVTEAHASGVPAPASGSVQRRDMIKLLQEIKSETKDMNHLLSSGTMRVMVEMPPNE